MPSFVFVIPTLSIGGAERVVSVLASAIAETGNDITVLKYYRSEKEYSLSPGVRVVNLSGGNRDAYDAMSYCHKVRSIRKVLCDFKPDIVIPFMFSVAMAVLFASVGLKTNVVQTIRINPALGPSSRIQRALRDCLVYRSKCTFVQNEQQRNYFKRAGGKVHILYNPVSSSLFTLWPKGADDVFTVCGVGRLTHQKNFTLLIDSFAAAFPNGEKAELKIFGDGPLMGELKNYITSIGSKARIRLEGRSERIDEELVNSNLFVLSSNFEGMPNALIEAMAIGLPCISTDCPTGPSDLIESGKNGQLVPVGDVDTMSKAIRFMYDNRDVAVQMGKEAKASVKDKCDAERIAQRMIAICASIKE